MKILLLNGSPRDGNTKYAMETVKKSLDENIGGSDIKVVDLADKKIRFCIGCNVCVLNNGLCVHEDDMAEIIEDIREADMIIFGSPVYWWGISAQLKTLIDRMYALMGDPGKINKKIGLIIIGQDSLEGQQYELINRQFQCICEYLKWDIKFYEAISADGPTDVKNNEENIASLKALWEKI